MGLEDKVKWAERGDRDADPSDFLKEHYIDLTVLS